MTVFLGILWSCIKEIEAPYVFDWEHGIPLHIVHWNPASSCGEVEVSLSFLDSRPAPGVYSRGSAGMGIGNSGLFCEDRTPVSS